MTPPSTTCSICITDVQTVRSCQTAAELDPEFTPEGYCSPNVSPSRGRQHRHAEGAAAHGRDPAHPARAHRWSWRRPTTISPTRRWPEGLEEFRCRRRLYRPPARGPAADGVGSCRLRSTIAESVYELHCQWRHPVLARAPAPRLQPLRGAGQRRAAAPGPADAEGRPAVDPQCARWSCAGRSTRRSRRRSPRRRNLPKPRYGGESGLITAPNHRQGWANASFEGSIQRNNRSSREC